MEVLNLVWELSLVKEDCEVVVELVWGVYRPRKLVEGVSVS